MEIGDNSLSREEEAKLKELLVANAGIFALDSSELGTTDVVTHAVNTGDHPPVRQHLRRIAFALCGQVTQMVEDMLVNQPLGQPSRACRKESWIVPFLCRLLSPQLHQKNGCVPPAEN